MLEINKYFPETSKNPEAGTKVSILEHRSLAGKPCISFKGIVVGTISKVLQVECMSCKSRKVIIDRGH